MIRVVIFLADGFEEVEAVTPIDYLRRAGVEVTVAGVGTLTPRGSQGICIQAEVSADELEGPFEGVILPGGMPGAENLAKSDIVSMYSETVMKEGGMVAAICAAPAVVLGAFGLLKGRAFTCYPGFEERIADGEFSDKRVVVDGNLITSRSAGCAGEFAVAIIRALMGERAADDVTRAVLMQS